MSNDDGGAGDFSGEGGNLNDRDSLFEEAAKWIVQSGDTASTSSLQRRYQIGYNRAGRIMDQMEAAGIVGPSQGGKPRKVLLTPMDIDQLFM
jgi:S-DNA-T family DNA segregation ATPase FtsK/SpoIIIE